MRKLLMCGAMAAAALLLLPNAPARAYGNGPWCLKAPVARGIVSERCDFRTFESCAGERMSWGNSSFCIQNSRYLPYWQGRGFGEDPTRKLSHKKKHRTQ